MPDLDILRQLAHDVGADTALKLLGIFKEDVDKRIAVIGKYLDDGKDSAELRIHAHSLKGLCRTYGAPHGGDAAMALQDACDGGNENDIRKKAQVVFDTIPGEVEAAINAARDLKET